MRTDQRNLKYWFEQCLVSLEHQQWLAKILGYEFEIHDRIVRDNKAVDVLSCQPETVSLVALILSPASNI